MSSTTASVPGEDPFVEAQVQQLLQEAGLDSAPFDPASFEALKKYLQQSSGGGTNNAGTTPFRPIVINNNEEEPRALETEDPLQQDPPLQNVDIYGPTSSSAAVTKIMKSPAPVEQRQSLFYPMGSDVTDPGSSVRVVVRNSTSNISAISGTSLTTKTEARILEQLQVQTTLILQLQRRVDELTDIVHYQQQQQQQQQPRSSARGRGGPPQLHRLMSELTMDEGSVQDSSRHRILVDHTPSYDQAVPAEETDTAPTEEAVAPQPAEPQPVPPREAAPARRGVWRRLLNPFQATRNSRMAKLYQIYVKMRNQQVQDIQWGVIVKVVVMLSILLGRMMSRTTRQQKQQSKEGDGESLIANVPFKVYVLVCVAFLGLFAQAGYLRFFYNFFVHERYPHRILLLGEDADVILQELEEMGRPDPQRLAGARGNDPQQQQGIQNAIMNWNQTFLLGGRIAPRNANNNPQQQPPQPPGIIGTVGNVLYDIVYLIGSFFLSIFPMWRPQPVPRPAPAEEEQPTQQHQQQQQEQQDGPGQVRPPGDPAANEEDDNEEEQEGDY